LADVDDPDLFCRHLLQLVQDDELRIRMGNGSGQFVMHRFSYQRLMTDMADFYYQLLSKKIPANAVFR
jgi:glycosyltransferase involved in cell wall biosynthesis